MEEIQHLAILAGAAPGDGILTCEGGMSAVAKTMRVLVGYASRFGSTRDIATRIADAVRTGGSEV